MKENLIQEKSFAFAVRIIRLSQYLASEKKEYVISKQILKSGTSIGANVEEAIGGQSRADFFAKITIAYKEARETSYWLKLLAATDYINEDYFAELENDILEIRRIIGAIQRSTKTN